MGNANAWTALQSFLNASTTQLSVNNQAWFGGTATSTFDSAGRLGVLTSSPTYPLEVTGSGRFTSLVDASYFVATTTTATSTFAGGLTVGTSTSKFVVNNFNGNVGFGTSTPSAPLDLANGKAGIALWAVTGANYKKASIGYSDAVAADVLTISTNAPIGGTYQDIQLLPNGGGSTNNGLYMNTSGQSAFGYTTFPDTSIGNALMVNGRVGIGTTTPSNALSITANGRATGDLRYGIQIVNSDSANTKATNIAFAGGGGTGASTGNWFIGTDINHDNSSNFFIATSTGPLASKAFVLNSEGSLTLADTGATPVTPVNKLYSLAGALWWNTTQLTSGTAVNYWSRASGNTYTTTIGDNVGAGTTTPYAKFAIHANNGETNTTLFAIASSTASATTTLFSISNAGTVSTNAIIPNGPYTTNLAGYDLGATGSRWNALWAGALNVGTSTFSIKSDSSSNLGFYTAASGGGTQALTITSAGNVGIGT
ncbi:MAG: hypothetical protein Q7R80_04750, partial [bacterium]|nr:hypothetical protein [bacterium]